MSVREKFEKEATDAVIYYLDEHQEWKNFNNDELDEYKETMIQSLFNEEVEYVNDIDCRNSVDDNCLWMCEVIDFVMERTAEEGETPRTTCVAMFNLYHYYIGNDLVYNEWDHLVQLYRDWDESKENNN